MTDHAGSAMALRYARVLHVGVVVILVVWHLGYDVVIIVRSWPAYDSHAAVVASWLILTAVQAIGSVLLLRDCLGTVLARALAVVAFAAGLLAVTAYPAGQALSDLSWAGNTVGWLGAMLLMRQPLRELIVLLAATTAVTVIDLAVHTEVDRVTAARLLTVVYATAGVQAMFVFVAGALERAARQVADAAADREEQGTRRATEDAVYAGRRRRYEQLRAGVTPFLRDLAEQRLDPADPGTRRIAGLEAARLRRLFAEGDDTDLPLRHELDACLDIADRRGVDVTFLWYGEAPVLATAARRHLTEVPLAVVASAATRVRLTVVSSAVEVVVAVIADAAPEAVGHLPDAPLFTVIHDEEKNELWVETRWQKHGAPSA